MERNPVRYHGILLLDKPAGMTSHDAVDAVRQLFGQHQVGHAGTLDPIATGLLVMCLGTATKVSQLLTEHDKTYEADLCLGLTSPTYDRASLPRDTVPQPTGVTAAQIERALPQFRGQVPQQVPPFSAVKVDGKRLYQYARTQQDVPLPLREISVSELLTRHFADPILSLTVSCSKGTYIRALAHDVGQALGSGAVLWELRRTRVGAMRIEEAWSLQTLAEFRDKDKLSETVLPIETTLGLGQVQMSAVGCEEVRQGRLPRWREVSTVTGSWQRGQPVAVVDAEGRLIALGVAANDSPGKDSQSPLSGYMRVLS